MLLLDLVKQRQDLQCSILKELNNEVLTIKLAADYMVECATNIKGQGYSSFINAREEFLSRIDALQQQITASIDLNCGH